MIKISNRLKSLAKYVDDGDKIMDVGCDHALLDIYLVQNHMTDKIYVCDVNPNALNNGIENIKKYGLEKNIIPILGYGIERADEYNIDTLIISGMGSNTIISILESPNLNRMYKLILQSNNNHYELRKFLMDKKFTIEYEEIVKDGKKEYINIIAGFERYPKKYTEEELMFGPILIQDKNNLEYFKEKKENIEDLFYKSHNALMKEQIDMLDNIIHNLEG